MALATWWRGDIVPSLPSMSDFQAAPADNADLVARLAGLAVGTVRARIRNGNQPFVAWVGSTPVAYGWSAQVEAEVGEYNLAFRLPPANRYLWDFATLPEWRGQGIYPRLLQAMMANEPAVQRFWIIYLPGNTASKRGIRKAGLSAVGELASLSADHIGLVADAAADRAHAGAALLAVPLLIASHWSAPASGSGPRPTSARSFAPPESIPANNTAHVRRASLSPGSV